MNIINAVKNVNVNGSMVMQVVPEKHKIKFILPNIYHFILHYSFIFLFLFMMLMAKKFCQIDKVL